MYTCLRLLALPAFLDLLKSGDRILVGGGEMHADCEKVLLEDGSSQRNIWGAGFMPSNQKMTFDSLINIRSRQNRSMEILDDTIREQVAQVIQDLLGGV